jgi:hypothetical protein
MRSFNSLLERRKIKFSNDEQDCKENVLSQKNPVKLATLLEDIIDLKLAEKSKGITEVAMKFAQPVD